MQVIFLPFLTVEKKIGQLPVQYFRDYLLSTPESGHGNVLGISCLHHSPVSGFKKLVYQTREYL